MTAVFVALLLGTGAMRLAELAVSVRRARARPDAVVAEGALFPVMAALHTALVALPLLEVFGLGRPFDPRWAALSAALLAGATALRIWTLRTIGASWNVRVVRPPTGGIATTGPYAWIRHPNYLCVIVEVLALPLFHGAFLSAAALGAWNAAVLVVRIRNEEAVLARIPEWSAAFANRARLIPGVF